MTGYTRGEMLERCFAAMSNIGSFYKQDFINYRGKTIDTGQLYTEVIAEFIIGHIDDFMNKIPCITRESTYKIKSHTAKYNPDSNRIEEIIAMKMFTQCKNERLNFVGRIIDYQTPLKNNRNDDAGKIDLLADNGQELILLELKKSDSIETMLRCVLEGYTYLKTVNKAKLLEDFDKAEDYGLCASPFVFKGSVQQREMTMACPMLRQLMLLLNSKPYYVSECGGKYFVTED